MDDDVDPGWYRDPARADGTYRWWTGTQWSDLLTDDPDVGPPPPGFTVRTVEASPAHQHRRRWVAVGVSTVVLLLLLVGMGVAGSHAGDQRSLPRSSVPTGPAKTAVAPWAIEPDGTIRFGSVATGTLPSAPPFDPPEKPGPIFGIFQRGTVTNFQVHPKTATQSGWWAAAATGWVDPDAVGSTPRETAEGLLTGVQQGWYSSVPKLTTSDVAVGSVPGFSADESCRVTMRIHYDIPGLASTYDDLVLMVIKVDQVNYAAWVADVPNDSPGVVKAAVKKAANSVKRV